MGDWSLDDIFIFEPKVFWADALFSTLGMTNICQLLSIRSVALVFASMAPFSPPEITELSMLIAQIIKFNIYFNKYNKPTVWQGTQFIKSPCLFVVSLIKI